MSRLLLFKDRKNGFDKFEINCWNDLAQSKDEFDPDSMVKGIIYFLDEKDNAPEDVLTVIGEHKECNKILSKILLHGELWPGYILVQLKEKLSQKFSNLKETIQKCSFKDHREITDLRNMLSGSLPN